MECQADDCEKPRYGKKDYCRMHYARLVRTGTVGGYKAIYNYDKICVADGCEEKYVHTHSQLCEWHYDDYREKVNAAATERLREAEELENIDTQDFWMWILKNYDPERLVKEGLK